MRLKQKDTPIWIEFSRDRMDIDNRLSNPPVRTEIDFASEDDARYTLGILRALGFYQLSR